MPDPSNPPDPAADTSADIPAVIDQALDEAQALMQERMAEMARAITQPTLGRIVLYRLAASDLDLIKNKGNSQAGQVVPAIVVNVFDPSINLHVFLDGPDTYWATSRLQGDLLIDDGCWDWPVR